MSSGQSSPPTMPGAAPHGAPRRRPGRVAVVIIVVGLLAVVGSVRPLRLPTPQPAAPAAFPHRDRGHPILLACAAVLYTGANSGDVAARPADLEWANVLTQVWGGCDVVTTADLARDPAQLLSGRRLVVLPRRTLAVSDTTLLAQLRPHVERGLWVLLERPPQAWTSPLGLAVQGEAIAPRLSWPVPPRGRGPRLEFRPPEPDPLPLASPITSYAPQPGARAPRPLLDMDGHAALWRLSANAGAWLVLGIDWAALSSSIRQGTPTRGFQVPQRRGRALRPHRTGDLVACEALRRSDEAWLDAWGVALFDAELADAPFPRAWPAPFARDGFAVLAHDDDGVGDRALWLTGEAGDARGPTTVFLTSRGDSLTATGAAAMLAAGCELALQSLLPGSATWRDPSSPRARWGLWKLRPLGRLPGIAEQRDALLAKLPAGARLDVHRYRGSLWPADADRAFGWLAASGFRADASFGPDSDSAGWAFGSGVPFQPLDRQGLSFPLWETPYLAVDTRGGFDRARLARWLRTNGRGGHGPVMVLLRSGAYAETPSQELFELWDAFPELVQRSNHEATRLSRLLDFWELRAQVQLRWEYAGRLLRVEVAAPRGAAAGGLAMTLPLRWHGLTLASWEADWTGAESRRSIEFDRDVRLFSLPDGRGELVATYR